MQQNNTPDRKKQLSQNALHNVIGIVDHQPFELSFHNI